MNTFFTQFKFFGNLLSLVKKYYIRHTRKIIIVASLLYILLIFFLLFGRRLVLPIATYLSRPRPIPLQTALGNADYLYSAKTKTFGAYIGEAKSNTPKITLQTSSESSMDFILSDLNPKLSKPVKSGNKVTFKDVRTQTDLTYETLTDGIKEQLIIKKPQEGNAFTFTLNTKNATPKLIAPQTYGSIFYNSKGEYQFHFTKPFAIDAKGARTDAVLLGIHKADKESVYTMRLIVNEKWLNDPARAYPIIIDPTIVKSISSDFTSGTHNRTVDTGSGSSPNLTTNYQELPLDTSTAGLWHMNEAGQTLYNSVDREALGIITTTVVPGQSGLGNAKSFNGTSDYISLQAVAGSALDIDTNPVTMEAWIKLNTISGSTQYIISRGQRGTVGYGLSVDATGHVNVGGHGGSNFSGPTILATGVWYHVAGVINGADTRIYVNGKLDATGTVNVVTTDLNFNLGASYNGSTYDYFFGGTIDEVRISKVARSAETIKSDASRRPYGIYTSEAINMSNVDAFNSLSWSELGVTSGDGETITGDSPFLQWNFNDTSGTTVSNTGNCNGHTFCSGLLLGFTSTGGQDVAATSGWTANNRRWGAGALMLDGVDDCVVMDSLNAVHDSVFVSTMSVGTWIKTNTTNGGTQQRIVSNDDYLQGGPRTYWYIGIDTNGYAKFDWLDTSTTTATALSNIKVNDGKWHYLVGTRTSGSNIKLYVDGVLSKTVSYSSTGLVYPDAPLAVGALRNNSYGGEYFNGVIDSMYFYKNRTFTADEVLSYYNAGNLEIQTRVGNTTDPNDGTWEAWKPTTSETQLDALDTDGGSELGVYTVKIGDAFTNQTWTKKNNAAAGNSDTTSTDGRIPLGTAGKGDATAIQLARVIKDGSTYKMWYSGNDGTNNRIYYATSPDGLTWTKNNNTVEAASDTIGTAGRIPLGTSGKGDQTHAYGLAVIKDGSTYKMWYSGHDGTNWRIYHATSPDGLTWTKYDNSVPSASDTTSTNGRIPLGTSGKGDQTHVAYPVVMKDGSTYKMWYSGHDGANWRIYYATSPDGLTWTKYNNTTPAVSDKISTNGRVGLGSAGTSDSAHAYVPTVMKDGDVYKMWYAMHMGNVRAGYATSPDGLTWTKYNNSIESPSNTTGTDGRLPIGASTLGDQTHALPVAVIKYANKYKMWYQGHDGANWRLYYASMAPTQLSETMDTTIKLEGAASEKLTTGRRQADSSTVGLWHLDETSGTGAYLLDSSGNGNNGSVSTTSVVNGVSGKARLINGGNIVVPNATSLNPTKITIDLWLKTTTTVDNTPIFKYRSGAPWEGYAINMFGTTYAGKPGCWVGGSAWTIGASAVNDGKWHHVACVYDGTAVTVYIDGVAGTPSVQTANLSYAGQDLFIGSGSAGDLTLDEVHISNSARTPEEIAEAYRMSRDTTITKTITSTDLSSAIKLPFSIAADRPGTYISATIGESAFANYETDANTVGFWHLDDDIKNPAKSCYALKLAGNTTDGVYTIDPDGPGGNAPLQVYCNMTYDGGGWTMMVKSWYGSGMIGNANAVGAVTDATTLKGNAYKLADSTIRNIIGPSQNFDVMVDQNGYNSSANGSTGNFEYVVLRNYTGFWTYERAMPTSTTTTSFQSYRASDQALAWTGNLACGYDAAFGVAGINCVGTISGTVPQGGAGCTINMGAKSDLTWHHFFMNQYNDDTYLYICNGAQYSSGQNMNHRFWVRERNPETAMVKDASGKSTNIIPTYITATGGLITSSNGYTIHTFTGNDTFQVTAGSGNVEALVIGGGGGGANTGSGGGGGGYVYNPQYPVALGNYSVTVGEGGSGGLTSAAPGVKGFSSMIIDPSYGITFAEGGGNGVSHGGSNGGNGGSGGGGSITTSGSTPTGGAAVQGNAGGAGFVDANWVGTNGGGGGAGAAGVAGGNTAGVGVGGDGKRSSINGTSTFYAGGGGGSEVSGSYVGTGGAGGGGEATVNAAGISGRPNTGGGGGGGAYNAGVYTNGGNGGSGIVIIRYPNTSISTVNYTNGVVSGAKLIQGTLGKARIFNGTSDYIQVGATAPLASAAFTADAWIKVPSNPSGANRYLNYGSLGSNKGGWLMGINPSGTIRTFQDSGCNGAWSEFSSTVPVTDGKWHHTALTYDGTTRRIYIDGVLNASGTYGYCAPPPNAVLTIGKASYDNAEYFAGSIDEVRLSNTARSADDIRQAYEVGSRTHQVTIDFGAKLDSANLINGVDLDLSFTIDATYYGFNNKGSNLYPGDKLIVKENYNGTDYVAQGTVNSVNTSTGAVTVSSWDSGSTFPIVGYTVNADVFKWQKEYADITGSLSTHRNATTRLTTKITNGTEGRTVWLDDVRLAGSYLTTSAGSTIPSTTGNQYFQYRVIESSFDPLVSSSLTSATIDYTNTKPTAPTIGTATAITSTSIRWTFTDTANNEDGFKVYDGSNVLKVTCAGANLTSCDETGLSVNTQYTRKIVAYNTNGNSPYSQTASKYTLAAAPAAPGISNRQPTTVVMNPDPGTNPSTTSLAMYKETGTVCDGTGGSYVASNGSDNGSTAAWQSDTAWGNSITVTGLNSEQQYAFCAKARNGDGIETAFGPTGINNGGYIPLGGNFVITEGMTSFINKYVDGSDPTRYVMGVDTGTDDTTNTASIEMRSGLLTINCNDTVVAGKFLMTGGSIVVAKKDGVSQGCTTIGGQFKTHIPLWGVDADTDGYTTNRRLWYGAKPTGGRRKNLLTTLATADCDDANVSRNVSCGGHRNITISYSGTTLTNSDVLVTVDTASSIASGFMTADCGDIRIKDSDNTTPLNYWIESGCNTSATQIWIRVPSIPNGGKTIYYTSDGVTAQDGETAWGGTFTMLYNTTCPSGWSRNSSLDGYFPYGSAASGITGGASSHSHAQVNVNTNTVASSVLHHTEANGGIDQTHYHSGLIVDIASASVLPPYLDMMFCSKSRLDVASGLISLFDALAPSGWTRFTGLDSKFPRGASTYGGTAGATTHSHTFTGGYLTSYAIGSSSAGGGNTQYLPGGHRHTSIGGTTATADNTPPYLNMVYASKNSTGVGIASMIVPASSFPPYGWTRFTGLDSKFPQGAATYGGTGGAATVAHSLYITTTGSDYTFGTKGPTAGDEDPPSVVVGHNHSQTTSTDAASNLPPYYTTIFVKRNAPVPTTSVGAEY